MHYLPTLIPVALVCLFATGCATAPASSETAEVLAAAPVPEISSRVEPEPATVQSVKHAATETQEQVTEVAPPSDVWERIRRGFKLEHDVDRKRVLNELKWYVNHPEYIDRVTKRAAPHIHYIVEQLESRGLPTEFALLPIVESAYDPFAYSHGRAAGLWQFIPSTARLYGLRIDWWYDGRRDVITSTKAAIDYLDYLHGMFNDDWLLALAAYNAGQGNVLSSIRRSNLDPDKVDFWSLKVLRETHTYVPRLLAISELIGNPGRYHMELPNVPNAPHWERVNVGSQIDLNKAAELADMSSTELYALNPGFNQWATHPDGPHELLIPIDKVERFEERLETLSMKDRVSWIRHKIKPGENLGLIAQKYNTTIGAIKRANNLKGNMIRAGHSVLIPGPNADEEYNMTREGRLASRHDYLKNTLNSEPITYIVQPGDSLWEIARRFDVNMRDLARWNGMGTTAVLNVGKELLIFTKKPELSYAGKQQVRKLNYRVRKGESLSLIASKFNLTVNKIKSWNQALNSQKYIHPGDRLTLYVDVTSLIN